MLFNSFAFIIFFIVVYLLMETIKERKWQHAVLLIASYFFYIWSSRWYFLIVVFSTYIDFYAGKRIYESNIRSTRIRFLLLSLFANLGTLFFFKYYGFFTENVNALLASLNIATLPYLHIILPVGISFYTFQSMSYTIDIYRGKLEPTNSLKDFALFVIFFPQLVAGPIVKAKEFLPQLSKKIVVTAENLRSGLALVGWGLVKKMVFADNISPLVNAVFAAPGEYNSIFIALAALGFAVQIYCDFSGYTDIAIGIAKIFNFHLPKNFDKPYFARNITEFWRKWHISLSSWLREYLYIPLGGNRKGKTRMYINLMITMMLGGLWHGASWNFLLWGTYQGGLLALHKRFGSLIPVVKQLPERIRNTIAILITFYFTLLGWILFRVTNTSDMIISVQKFVLFDFVLEISSILHFFTIHFKPLFFLGLFCILHTFTYWKPQTLSDISVLRGWKWAAYIAVVSVAVIFFGATDAAFIYFQF